MEDMESAFNEIFERLGGIEKFIKALEDKVDSIDKIIYEDILNPIEEIYKEYDYNNRLNDWTDKHYDTLNPYIERIKAIEGDDFDVYKQSFDDYNAIEGDKPDESEYVQMLSKMLDEQIDKIRKSLGVSDEATIEIKDDGGNNEPIITVKESEETIAEELPTEPTESAEGEQSVAEDEVTKYENELKDYLDKSKSK